VEALNDEIEFSYRFEASAELGPHARVCLSSPRSTFEHLPVPLKGEHQAFNCGLALAILDRLRERGIATPEGPVAAGLAKTNSNGRLELVHTQPRIMIDGAHNPESISALVKAIGAQVRYDSMVVVFGCAADKDVAGMLANLALGADKMIFTKAEGSDRAMDPRDLARKFTEVSGRMALPYPTLKEALNKAAQASGATTLSWSPARLSSRGRPSGSFWRRPRASGSPRIPGAPPRRAPNSARSSPRSRPPSGAPGARPASPAPRTHRRKGPRGPSRDGAPPVSGGRLIELAL
jgi:hypothetical protein